MGPLLLPCTGYRYKYQRECRCGIEEQGKTIEESAGVKVDQANIQQDVIASIDY